MPDATIKDLLARSGLVFTGTVDEAGASTVSDVPVDERTVVVRVGEALHAPGEVDLPPGARVTVQLADSLPPLGLGDEATFFANGVVYGENLAVAEVGRVSPEEVAGMSPGHAGLAPAVSPMSAVIAELALDEVVEHARSADAVVRGQVTGLQVVKRTGLPQEHDPLWWIATLHVDLVARGGLAAPSEVPVLYANSLDVRWRRHLKPKAGQGGLWLLHGTQGEAAVLAQFMVIHELDLQDSIMLDVLRDQGM